MASHHLRRWPSRIPLRVLKIILNFWPPYLGAGIKIKNISADFHYIKVIMKLRWYNKNLVGTHYGGSIYSMADGFFMLMLIKILGENYIVWDKAARIEFKKPGRGMLHAVFQFSEEEIAHIQQQAKAQKKYIFDRTVNILNQQGEVVASVVKTLYVQYKSSD